MLKLHLFCNKKKIINPQWLYMREIMALERNSDGETSSKLSGQIITSDKPYS